MTVCDGVRRRSCTVETLMVREVVGAGQRGSRTSQTKSLGAASATETLRPSTRAPLFDACIVEGVDEVVMMAVTGECQDRQQACWYVDVVHGLDISCDGGCFMDGAKDAPRRAGRGVR